MLYSVARDFMGNDNMVMSKGMGHQIVIGILKKSLHICHAITLALNPLSDSS